MLFFLFQRRRRRRRQFASRFQIAGARSLPLEAGEVPQMRMVRFRSLGCYPLSAAVESPAATLDDLITEMEASRESERAGRLIDGEGGASMEAKKVEGYF